MAFANPNDTDEGLRPIGCVRDVLIVGAGLAGLSAAIALARRGVRVTVATLETRAEGTSITITNRAVDAVEALCVVDACIAQGVVPAGHESIFSVMMDHAGNPLPVPPPPPPENLRLPPWIAIFRPDLGRILGDAARAVGVEIRDGVTFESLEPGGHVALSDGTRAVYDLVIGADGAHSAVRAVTHPDMRPTFTGTMSFRIVLDDAPAGHAGFYTHPSYGALATVRLPGNRLYLAAGMRMDNRRLDQDEALDLLGEVLDRYPAPLIAAIRAALGTRPHVYARPFEWLLLPSPWHRGNTILIGDAAHATTPNLASGGSIALEDGVVLGEELARAQTLAEAFDAFMARRYARTAMVVETSLEMMQRAAGDPRETARLRSRALAELVKPY